MVQVGDTVFDLAMAFGITVNEIKAANPSIILDRIAVGQRLAMPKGAERVAEPTAEPEDPNALHHLVQAGENLGGIAALYDVDPLEIARINSLTSPDRLGIGQKLLLPKNATLLELPTEEPIGGESLVHTVAAGETLSSIALQYEVRLSDLVKANNLQNADQLALGQKIHVPAWRLVPQRASVFTSCVQGRRCMPLRNCIRFPSCPCRSPTTWSTATNWLRDRN